MKKLGKWVNTNGMNEQEALLEFLIHKRETHSTQDNHKSKPKSSLKCLVQDHTGQRRPRMEADYSRKFI